MRSYVRPIVDNPTLDFFGLLGVWGHRSTVDAPPLISLQPECEPQTLGLALALGLRRYDKKQSCKLLQVEGLGLRV